MARNLDRTSLDEQNTELARPLLAAGKDQDENEAQDSACDNESLDGDGLLQRLEWTEDEERRLVTKIDRTVLALLVIGFLALQYDRGNIGNALTDHLLEDIGITQNQFNLGQQLLSSGITLLEIPSNLILYQLGPRTWIGCQMIAWGLVSLFQAFQKGLGAFLTTRLLLGLCESGFIPAGLYCITTWYKKEETSKRFSWFFLGNMLAQASSGFIAYGILHMRGFCNLAGWQWLFILEGLFTVGVGFLFVAFFPKDPAHPVSFVGIRYFDDREIKILVQRVLRDDPAKQKKHTHVSMAELVSALTNWRMYPHLLLAVLALAPTSTLASYGPTLVHSFGFEELRSNALASVAGWIQLGITIFWGTMADRTANRGYWVLSGVFLWWSFCLGSLLSIDSMSRYTRYFYLIGAMSVSNIWHPVNGSWMSLNARSPGERSITMAMFIMAANLAGVIGSQLFQGEDGPKYYHGWSLIVGLIFAGVVFAVVANIQYRVLNKRIQGQNKDGLERPENKLFQL